MSHFGQINGSSNSSDDRNLGDEWIDWDGKGEIIHEGKRLFVIFSLSVIVISDLLLLFLVYMISPRLAAFHEYLPSAVWVLSFLYIALTVFWFVELLLTAYYERNYFFFRGRPHRVFEHLYNKVSKLASLCGVSRDRLGHSFVKVSNAISRATKIPGRDEKLLILLPRCLTKEELKRINDFKNIYPIEICVVSGGELARKKVKELRPTAVIGVACERDLVAGIRDVGGRFSVIGVPNIRPNGPCKDTNVDMVELERAIQFYVGRPKG